MLLNRYSNIDYVMNLSFTEGIELIGKANIKIAEDMLFQQWNMEHIYMKEDEFITFEEYKSRVFGNKNRLSKEEVHEIAKNNIAEAEKIRELIKKGGNS